MYKIKEIPLKERPRERLIKFGAHSLSDSELISIVLRSGGPGTNVVTLSQGLLKDFGGLRGLLFANFTQLQQVRYLGAVKACTLSSVAEICRRSMEPDLNPRHTIVKPQEVFELIRPRILGKQVECLYLLSLDLSSRLIKVSLISTGSISQTLADTREIVRCALLNGAISVILVHNHPSGSTTPSDTDIAMTSRVAEACVQVGVVFLDHIIVSSNSFYSFKASGLLNSTIRKEVRK